jgi:uncharacterized membrane protein YeaQ/YmgE (transglycosylase-associated protein family)
MTARKAAAGLFGAFVGAWLGRAAFKWVLDVPGEWQIVLIAATAIVGAVICVTAEEESRTKGSSEAAEE